MSKKTKILISVILLILLGSVITYLIIKKDNKKVYVVTEESLKFEKEYEELNGQKTTSENRYLDVNLVTNAPIKYTSYEEIFKILENGTGVIYFGFPECPWCRNLVEPLINSAMDYGLDTIYYLNNREDRNTLVLDKKGKIKTKQKGTEEYLKLIKILDKYLPEYDGLKDKKIKRLYFPTVIFVKAGNVLGLEQSLKTYSARVNGNAYKPMLDTEKTELENIFKEYYKKLETN